jgi:hypothetical protein
MKKYPFLPEGRERNHIPKKTENQLIRRQAKLGEATVPWSLLMKGCKI